MQPVADRIHKFYGYSDTIINTMSLATMVIYVVLNFPSNFVIDMYGCRNSVVSGIVLTTVGMTLKIFINYGFWICILGQIISAIG